MAALGSPQDVPSSGKGLWRATEGSEHLCDANHHSGSVPGRKGLTGSEIVQGIEAICPKGKEGTVNIQSKLQASGRIWIFFLGA